MKRIYQNEILLLIALFFVIIKLHIKRVTAVDNTVIIPSIDIFCVYSI